MRYRSAGRLGPEDIGHRVTVRVRNDDGSASDTVGILRGFTRDSLRIETADGHMVDLAVDTVVAARRVG